MLDINLIALSDVIPWINLCLLLIGRMVFLATSRFFYKLYIRKHLELERRLTTLEHHHDEHE